MILDHPVVPLLGRLMMAYIFGDQRDWESIWMVRQRGVHEHQALAADSGAAGCGDDD